MIDSEPLGNDPTFPEHNNGAVLLSNQIARFADRYSMIKPFNLEHLKPASYYLTLGAECQQKGEYVTLSESNPYIEIKPYELAVLSTDETINLPRFIVGRWSIRVHMAYEGLLWVGGPQVDPGYQGKLHSPIYNLSSHKVTLKYQDPIFTIDFVYTTPFDESEGSKCKKFQLNRQETLRSLDIHKLQSGLVKTADDAKETLKKTEEISKRVDHYLMLTFIVLSVIIMVVTVLAVGPVDTISWSWSQITFGISIVSLVLAMFAIIVVVRRRH